MARFVCLHLVDNPDLPESPLHGDYVTIKGRPKVTAASEKGIGEELSGKKARATTVEVRLNRQRRTARVQRVQQDRFAQ